MKIEKIFEKLEIIRNLSGIILNYLTDNHIKILNEKISMLMKRK